MSGSSPQGNVSIQSKGDGIHEFGGVGNQSKKGYPKELFIDTRVLQDNVNDADQQFYWALIQSLNFEVFFHSFTHQQ